MSNICPTAGIASIVSEQGTLYCDTKATGPTDEEATSMATSTGTGTGSVATATSVSPTATANSGNATGEDAVFSLAASLLAGLLGLAVAVL